MKLAIVSDAHLGYAPRTMREQESFDALKQAFQLAVQQKADFILMAGDLFDCSIPSQETLHAAFELLGIPKKADKVDLKISKSGKQLEFSGIPVLSIHGTHEFRGKDYKNSLQVLESGNALVYFHAETVFLEKPIQANSLNEALQSSNSVGMEKIAVQGFGGVPEKKALDAVRAYSPQPITECFNVFVFHQSLKDYLPADDEMSCTLGLEDLPKNFDLYIDGHLHWHSVKDLHSGKFIIPGSTIFTQMKKLEAEKPKGIVLFDTQTKAMEFLALPMQRKLFYHKLKFENANFNDIQQQLRKTIDEDLASQEFKLKPLFRFKLVGSLAKGLNNFDLDLNSLLEEYSDKAFFSVSKTFSSDSFKARLEELRELQKQKKSITSIGLGLLEKNLKETSFDNAFDTKQLFDLLSEGDLDKALQVLEEIEARKQTP